MNGPFYMERFGTRIYDDNNKVVCEPPSEIANDYDAAREHMERVLKMLDAAWAIIEISRMK